MSVQTEDRCTALVSERGTWGSFHRHRCTYRAKVRREVDGKEVGFCTHHDPVRIAEKNELRSNKWQRQRRAEEEKQKQKLEDAAALVYFRQTLEAIWAGHNDPRTAACAALKRFPPR